MTTHFAFVRVSTVIFTFAALALSLVSLSSRADEKMGAAELSRRYPTFAKLMRAVRDVDFELANHFESEWQKQEVVFVPATRAPSTMREIIFSVKKDEIRVVQTYLRIATEENAGTGLFIALVTQVLPTTINSEERERRAIEFTYSLCRQIELGTDGDPQKLKLAIDQLQLSDDTRMVTRMARSWHEVRHAERKRLGEWSMGSGQRYVRKLDNGLETLDAFVLQHRNTDRQVILGKAAPIQDPSLRVLCFLNQELATLTFSRTRSDDHFMRVIDLVEKAAQLIDDQTNGVLDICKAKAFEDQIRAHLWEEIHPTPAS